ncbi:MAG: response regulator, partial [Bacteroidales bacterium]|nr:response regulator [Bacteroidales bacterium]
MVKILVIDDEAAICRTMKNILEDEGYSVDTASDGLTGLSMAEKSQYSVIFCDIKMPGMDGVEVLSKMVSGGIDSTIVMISGHADIETAVSCIKAGAFDFIAKPLDLSRILITVRNATDKDNLKKETRTLKKK